MNQGCLDFMDNLFMKTKVLQIGMGQYEVGQIVFSCIFNYLMNKFLNFDNCFPGTFKLENI